MVIPNLSPNEKNGSTHFLWFGIEPRDGSVVFQNVLSDDQPVGQWTFAVWDVPDVTG